MDYQEKEIKLYICDLPALEARLRISGADLVRERTLESNFRLDTPEKSLKKNGRLLRIRKDDKVWVTYKDRGHVEEGVVTRREIEFVADDLEIVKQFFKALGYDMVAFYEKYRTVYRFGDVEVALDELPYGDFVEIEAPNNILIEGVVRMLGLDWSKRINTNYLGLLENAKKSAGLTFKKLTFKNFAALEISELDLGVEPADT